MDAKQKKHLLLFILYLLILGGSFLSLVLFRSSDLNLGMIPVLIVALLFHPLWAAGAGLLSALIISLGSTHLFIIPVFVLEALFVSLVIRRRKKGTPLVLSMLYWIPLGTPLSILLYTQFSDLGGLQILLRVDLYFLNSLFAASAATLILSRRRILQHLSLKRFRLNQFFGIISSCILIIVLTAMYILINLQGRLVMDRNIRRSSDLMIESLRELEEDIESYTDSSGGSDLLGTDTLQDILERVRKDRHQSIAIRDAGGDLLAFAGESPGFEADLNDLSLLSGGDIRDLGQGVLLWMPRPEKFGNRRYLEALLIHSSGLECREWTIYSEFFLRDIIYERLETISFILLMLSLFILLLMPLLFLVSKNLVKTLDDLILLSSRSMYGLDGTGEKESWPESSVWEFSHLSYRLKEVISHQEKAVQLLNRQNQALSEMNGALGRSEENLRITLNSIADGVIVSDDRGRLLSINPVASRLTGYMYRENETVLLRDILKLKDEFTAEIYDDFLDDVLRKGVVLDSAVRYHIENPEGDTAVVTLGAAPIRMSRKEIIRGAVVVLRDISASRELEDQLRQSQKMEIVGQLAGGIAHDFNNLLGGIMGMISVMKLDLEDNSLQTGKLNDMTLLISRASDLTAKLLSFSRKGKMVSSSLDYHAIMEETLALLAHTFPGGISIQSAAEASACHIQGDPTEVQRVLMNLALNARDAMSGEGVFTVTTGNLEAGTWIDSLTGRVRLESGFLTVRVSDTGKGIPPEIIEHVFEPFFSTKDLGQGSGLGLSAVYGSLLEHNGYIHLESREGEGTLFTLFYPLVD